MLPFLVVYSKMLLVSASLGSSNRLTAVIPLTRSHLMHWVLRIRSKLFHCRTSLRDLSRYDLMFYMYTYFTFSFTFFLLAGEMTGLFVSESLGNRHDESLSAPAARPVLLHESAVLFCSTFIHQTTTNHNNPHTCLARSSKCQPRLFCWGTNPKQERKPLANPLSLDAALFCFCLTRAYLLLHLKDKRNMGYRNTEQ